LQVGQSSALAQARAESASAEIKVAARKAHDSRLTSLAARVMEHVAPSHFATVVEMIDGMISSLRAEEQTDLTTKEGCEEDRAENTRSVAEESRTIDDISDEITSLNSRIEQVSEMVAATQKDLEQIKTEEAEAIEIRDEEHKERKSSDADDKEAAELVEKARNVLAEFYTSNDLMLSQVDEKPAIAAGQAPSTWDQPYKGVTGLSGGILSILDTIHDDILKDQRKALAEDNKAQASRDEARKVFVKQESELRTHLSSLSAVKGQLVEDVATTKMSRNSAKGRLDAVLHTIKDVEPGCNFAAINYKVRASNRQIEIDGLLKAKAVLSGAEFSLVDEGRSLRLGDAALLQRSVHLRR